MDRKRSRSRTNTKDDDDNQRDKKTIEYIFTKAGGAYIPPTKLRRMQGQICDKSSESYQKIAWEALKKSINGFINKVNVSNLKVIITELFKENLVRGRGVLVRSLMQAQAVSPTFTHVYAAVAAVINTKFPQICELLLRRLIIQFRKGYRRNDKLACVSSTRFIAHLVNQQVAHEVLALEILTLLLENPTEDSLEMFVGFLKECGQRLTEASKDAVNAIFDRLRSILHDAKVDKRVQYMIEVMFAIRKDKFKVTVSKYNNNYSRNYFVNSLRRNYFSEESQTIIDNTETNLVSLRRTIYLVIQSSLDFEECAHKLLKLELQPGHIVELCYMILDCCAQQRTYEKFFGLLAQRFCQLNKIYVEPFEDIFKTAYDTIHRFETNKLRNVARFFAHLLYTDAISWLVLSHIKLNEDDTTSSSRIFIKILFQELCEYMGLLKLNERVKDPTMQEAFDGLFPRDTSRNTRFAINFFTSIGLGGLTDELREHLKNVPKPSQAVPQVTKPSTDEDSSSSEEESSESESAESESSEEESRKKLKNKSSKPKNKKKKKKSKHHKKSKKKNKG
ncbi:pre-mRNA-splicing factor CWC22 homolog [Centruroides sculpturatus]|uniref:pre-mRNA-splicing factor CWC22 homolog n=1 Tax=Centruroides sculpturatus TaxID=218467 RepID=UPI000C6D73D1|nr:pre-mRNA-splicing factor CWC22 homolog [Centruroides sculpturatus]